MKGRQQLLVLAEAEVTLHCTQVLQVRDNNYSKQNIYQKAEMFDYQEKEDNNPSFKQ